MKNILFVCDLFVDEYIGGAELTTEAIIEKTPNDYNIIRIKSASVTEKLIEEHKDDIWVFGNFSGVDFTLLLDIIKKVKNYYVLEYDFKFCEHRSIMVHERRESECNCQNTQKGKITFLFLTKSKAIFWMSERQFKIQKTIFPSLEKTNNIVLSSVFSERDIKYIKELNNVRNKKNNKFIILNSFSPIKNTEGCIEYAKNNNLEYKLIDNLPYFLLLRELSNSRGLIFLPSAEDTCPRIVIEAKLLDCEIILNKNVLHAEEEWYDKSKELIFDYLQNNCNLFWNFLKDK